MRVGQSDVLTIRPGQLWLFRYDESHTNLKNFYGLILCQGEKPYTNCWITLDLNTNNKIYAASHWFPVCELVCDPLDPEENPSTLSESSDLKDKTP